MNKEQRTKKVVTATICAFSIFCMGFVIGQYEQREIYINGKVNTNDNSTAKLQKENSLGVTNE